MMKYPPLNFMWFTNDWWDTASTWCIIDLLGFCLEISTCVSVCCVYDWGKRIRKTFFALPQMFNFFPREYICNLFSDAFRAYQPLISSVCALHLYNSSALLPSSYSTKDEIIKRGPRNDYVYEDIDPEWKSCLQSWSQLTFHTQKSISSSRICTPLQSNR